MNYKQADLVKTNLKKAIQLLNNFHENESVFDVDNTSDCLVMSVLELTEMKLVYLLDVFENEKEICLNCEGVYFSVMAGAFIEMFQTQVFCEEVSLLVDELSALFTPLSKIFNDYYNPDAEDHLHFINPLFTKAELN